MDGLFAVCRISGEAGRKVLASLVSDVEAAGESKSNGTPGAGRVDEREPGVDTSFAGGSGVDMPSFEILEADGKAGVGSPGSSFLSVTRTADEVSVVCAEDDAPDGATVEGGWRAMKVEGTLNFSMTGVLASIAVPLADAEVPIFVVSTFDTDYVLINEADLENATSALERAGHEVSSEISIRFASDGDRDFMWTMLSEAAHEPDVRVVPESPELSVYLDGWGRDGDVGVVAEIEGRRAGAAWVRLLGESGYGFVDEDTPELAIAVHPDFRGRGVGEKLLVRLMDEAAKVYSSVSLSVKNGNPARRLYERVGFEVVEGGDTANRAGEGSATMKKTLQKQ